MLDMVKPMHDLFGWSLLHDGLFLDDVVEILILLVQ